MPAALLVRHALSVWNVEGRWQGQADPPLSREGEAEARAASAAVGAVDLVVTSDLERARRTGQLLAPGVPQVSEPALRELDVGAWSGRTRAEIQAAWPEQLARFDAGLLETAPGGEQRAAFDDRVREAAARVAATVTATGAAHTLVVAHGGVIRALTRLQGWPDRHIGHLCGYQAEVKGGTLMVVRPLDLLSQVSTSGEPGDQLAL
jgi:broad specificity phosphatase PhoE